ncbi:transcriptional Coactivator p15-domain-containing protein [Mycena vulgaris]|nr:transcriptional Coactivator p15-domain-containing protein [Mycena vulgaris]
MAKRKSLTTPEEDDSSKLQAKPSKKVKTEQVEQDELDDSETEAPLKVKKPSKYTTKTEDTDAEPKGAEVQCTAEGDKYIDLGKNKRATVRSFKGNTLVDIREFYTDKASGEAKPGKKGISLGVEQWEALKGNAATIDDLIAEKK